MAARQQRMEEDDSYYDPEVNRNMNDDNFDEQSEESFKQPQIVRKKK